MNPAAAKTSHPNIAIDTIKSPLSSRQRYKPHWFNPSIAESYGIPAALIFQYIWFRSVNMADGKWVTLSLEDFYKQYPYLGQKQVWLALQKLVNSHRKTPALVCRKPADEGYSYRYAPISRDAGNKFISFDTRIAAQHGIVPAIIHANIAYWVRDNWRAKAERLYEYLDPAKFDYDDLQLQSFAFDHTRKAAAHYVSVKKWAKLNRYISERTAKRGFSSLLTAGLLKKLRTRNRIPLWIVQEKLLHSFMRERLNGSDLENERAKRKKCGPKSRSAGQDAKVRAKMGEVFPPTDSASSGNESVVEAGIVEADFELRSKKLIDVADDVLRPEVADAPTGSEAASDEFYAPSVLSSAELQNTDLDFDDDEFERNREPEEDFDEFEANRIVLPPVDHEHSLRALGTLGDPDIFKMIRLLNRPSLPVVKTKITTGSEGGPIKRKYVRIYSPDDPRYSLDTLENLTPEERTRYLEQAKKKRAAGKIYVQANGSPVKQSSGC